MLLCLMILLRTRTFWLMSFSSVTFILLLCQLTSMNIHYLKRISKLLSILISCASILICWITTLINNSISRCYSPISTIIANLIVYSIRWSFLILRVRSWCFVEWFDSWFFEYHLYSLQQECSYSFRLLWYSPSSYSIQYDSLLSPYRYSRYL